MSRVVLKHDNLDALIEAFGSKSPLPVVQVGILGNDVPRFAGTVSEETGKVSHKGFTVATRVIDKQFLGVKIYKKRKKYNKIQEDKTNAEVGAAHEFGNPDKKLPQRSWLRVPIMEHLQSYLEKAGKFDDDAIKQVIKDRSIRSFMKMVGVTAETVVEDGFATAGFGKWSQWKAGDYHNNTGQILVDSGRLQRAVNSRVKSGKS